MLTHHHFLGKTSTNPLSHRQQINLSSSELQLVSKPTTVYSEQHYQQILFFFFNLWLKWEVKVVSVVRKTFIFLSVFTVYDLIVMDQSVILVVLTLSYCCYLVVLQ